MNIVYVTLVDISKPTGPGTNELEFVNAMQAQSKKYNDKSYSLTMQLEGKTQYEIRNHFEFVDPNHAPSFMKAFKDQASYLKQFKDIIQSIEKEDGKIDLFVFRLDGSKLFSCLNYLIKNKRPYAIKHFHTFLDRKVTGINSFLHQFQLRKICKKAICIDTTWKKMVEHLRKVGVENVTIVDNGTNIEKFIPADKAELKKNQGFAHFSHIISYIGGVPLERGAEEIIKSVPIIKKEFPDAGFLIIGDNKKGKSHLEKMKHLSEKTGFQDSVIIKGLIPFEEVPPYFQLSDVGVALVPEEIVENFGNSSQKIYQYLASGIPVVVPKNCHEDLLDAGFVQQYQYNGVEEFAQHVIKLIQKGISNDEIMQTNMHDFVTNNYSAIGKYEDRRNFWLNHL